MCFFIFTTFKGMQEKNFKAQMMLQRLKGYKAWYYKNKILEGHKYNKKSQAIIVLSQIWIIAKV